MNPKVDFYFRKQKVWQAETELLRAIILETGLVELLKWGVPCYALEERNIVLIHTFKHYCAVLFFKGVLLSDKKNVLVQQTANVQAARQMRFATYAEIEKAKNTVNAYVKEAIQIEKSGKKVELKKTAEFNMPVEFKEALEENENLKKAFQALTPGRQRGYLLHFDSAKQAATRKARIEKSTADILCGKGLND